MHSLAACRPGTTTCDAPQGVGAVAIVLDAGGVAAAAAPGRVAGGHHLPARRAHIAVRVCRVKRCDGRGAADDALQHFIVFESLMLLCVPGCADCAVRINGVQRRHRHGAGDNACTHDLHDSNFTACQE